MKVSGLVYTYNAEKTLDACLKCLSWTDEIVIVDMHSTDQTVKIAGKYTDKIFLFEKMGYFEKARIYGVSKTAGEWVFILDADETIGQLLVATMKGITRNNSSDVVYIPRKNIIFKRWIQHTAWWPDYIPRFFKKEYLKLPEKIHAPWEVINKGRVTYLPAKEENAIEHYAYADIAEFIARLNRYTTCEAEYLYQQGQKFNCFSLILRPFAEFINRYFRHKGYLDGFHGFILSILMGYYFFATWIKLWEIEKNENT